MLFWSEKDADTATKDFLEDSVVRGNEGDDNAKKAEMMMISGIIKRYQGTENACPGGKTPGNPESIKAEQTIRGDAHLLLRLLTLRDNTLRDEAKMQEICINRINRLIKADNDVSTAEDVITFLKGDVQ
jgi:hypothetical protein